MTRHRLDYPRTSSLPQPVPAATKWVLDAMFGVPTEFFVDAAPDASTDPILSAPNRLFGSFIMESGDAT